MDTMNKTTKKPSQYIPQAVKMLSKKYEVSTRYVLMAINGERINKKTIAIKKDYITIDRDLGLSMAKVYNRPTISKTIENN